MTHCPDTGRWRAYLDGETVERAALATHLEGCGRCRATLAELQATADFSRARLAALAAPAPVDVRRAWAGVQARLGRRPAPVSRYERIRQMLTRALSGPARLALSGAGVALAVLLVLALTPAGSQALQALSIFRVQTFKAITIEVDPATLPAVTEARKRARSAAPPAAKDPDQARQQVERDLAAVGITLKTTIDERTVRVVADIAAARAAAKGVPVRTLGALPDAFAKVAPRVYVADPSTSSATVDLAAFRKAVAEAKKARPEGAPEIDPAKLPGIDPTVSSVSATLQTAFSVVQVYGEGETALVFAQGASPELTLSEGIDILAIRDALLAMPAIPKTTRTQLLSIRDDEWTRTLIIPVPQGTIVKDVTVGGALGNTVGGAPGLLILSPDGHGGAVLWQHAGVLYAVGGGYGEDVLLKAANSVQ